jgi:uncharacterized RDD family membrane protein YckC
MKCPKCGYLGYEDADRCRNCGYDFSLSASAPLPELPLRIEQTGNPLTDDLRFSGKSEPAPAPHAKAEELQLVFEAAPDDEPLIKHPSAPRAPLAVRRSTPDVPRVRADQPRVSSLDFAGSDAGLDLEHWRQPVPARPDASDQPGRERMREAAGLFSRLVAVAIDLLILGAVDALVIYFTLQICNLTIADLALLPRGPLITFLLVQNGGYLVVFTAGGQTLGKMTAGIRVVPAEADASLDVGKAFLRELIWLALALPAGLGFLSACFSRDHRGIHDRLAGTRVVR